MKALPGTFAVGSYTGTAGALSITGVGFNPDVVIIKNQNTADGARILTTDMVNAAQASIFLTASVTTAQGITTLDTNGFSVGTDAGVNGSGNTLHWLAFKSGNFNAPVTRLTA